MKLLAIPIMVLFASCAKSIYFENSSVEPAAVGKVKIMKDRNANYALDISIMHLADPKRLSPPKEMYVVWAETPHNDLKNIGRIHTGSGLLSSTLKGELKTVTTFKPKKVFITAEEAGEVHEPGNPVVLSTTSF